MPRSKGTAVLLIDVINTFDFRGSGPLVRAAKMTAPKIEGLARKARTASVPIVYVNDNFGRWSSDFKAIVRESTAPHRPGREIGERLRPVDGDYFVLKPQHSGFYATPLELLLEHLNIHTVVLAGFAANICVQFTANDAHIRGYHIVVPRDCSAANSPALARATMNHVRSALGGITPFARAIDFAAFQGRKKKPRGQAF